MEIKLLDLSHTYEGFKKDEQVEAVNNVSLSINQVGEFVAVCGKTGSGKSTMIQHMNALLLPTKGQIDILGSVITPKKRKNPKLNPIRKKVGFVFQFPEYQLFEDNIEKDVSFGPKNFGLNNQEALKEAHEALKLVGLGEEYYKKSPFELSGGQKRRVAIAGIIASKPDVLVLDEPTAGLDPKGAKEMLQLFKDIHSKGVTIVLVTHDMDIVLEYAEDVVVVQNGEIKEHCSPDRKSVV